jgi:glyoxylase-like metal-dependent hydrolase (beta-lactamase superfamily II)
MQGGRLIGVAVAAALFCSLGPAISVGRSAEPNAQPFRIGTLQAYSLEGFANIVPNDGRTFGVGHSPEEVSALLQAAGLETKSVHLAIDALLVKSSDRLMLFDAGIGPMVLESMTGAGISPYSVTDVFITHGHHDHVGGLISHDGRLFFPHAVIHISTREWAWMRGAPQNGALVKAISSQVKTFEPGEVLAPGVEAVPLYGHTPGHVGYRISSGSAHLFDMGDIAHSAIVSMERPDWLNGYDVDQDEGRKTRLSELAELAQSHELVFGPHMPFPGLGHVEAKGAGYVWAPAPL